ncbi:MULTISPECIES: phosphotransferase [unclassified Sinorhizobium]|uniref:phosphotransferase n=1 Tax=unclassified Sinorhizobium TaxID=2613772 RepID=UPI003525FB61
MPAIKTEADENGLGAELKTGAAAVPADQAERIALEKYGLGGRAEWLWGEKDSNYRITLAGGTAYLLKILNPAEDPRVTNMHSQALLHVEALEPSIPVQRIVRTKDGEADFRVVADDGSERGVRMVTFLRGTAQRTSPHSAIQRRRIGILLGRMQKALESFSHEAAFHRITWDMKHAMGMRDLMPAFPDAAKRARLERAINEFGAEIVPAMASLPSQIIHNDFNMENILVDPDMPDEITGIIDFGDMVHAPILFDVAVAAAYQMGNADDPVEAICDFLRGYRTEKRLSDGEIGLLYPAAVMRLVMRLAIPQWRAQLFPEHAERFTLNSPTVWQQLARLDGISKENAIERFRAANR